MDSEKKHFHERGQIFSEKTLNNESQYHFGSLNLRLSKSVIKKYFEIFFS